jgi:lactoylglutathione lyase
VFLDYAGIRVQELERSVKFYTEAAGLQELRRGSMGHGGVWVLLGDPASSQRLELNWYPEGSPYATPFSAGEGLDHLGFRVADLAGAVAQFTAAGAKVVEELKENGAVVLVYLSDPDGLWIELIPSEML